MPPPPAKPGTSKAAAPAKGGIGSWFWFLGYLTLIAGLAAGAYKAYEHFVLRVSQNKKCPTFDPKKLRWPPKGPEGKSLWCKLFCCCKKD